MDLAIYVAVYLHFVAMYFLWLMVTTAFSTSFMVSSLVILIFLFLIIRNNIVAAEVFKIDFEDLRRQSGGAPDGFTLVYMTLFGFCVFGTGFQKSFISNILIWPTVNFPKITLAFNILTVMIFIILYAFFLTSTFQIVTYVLFIIVYGFNIVIYLRPAVIVWIISLLCIPAGMFVSCFYPGVYLKKGYRNCYKHENNEQRQNPRIEAEQDVRRYHPGIFNNANTVGTVNILSKILKDWRRTYSLRPDNQNDQGCVCLVEFKKGDDIIQLHGGKNHLFHPDCIEDWARRHKTGPLGRKDFLELAREEQYNRPLEELKESSKEYV